MKKTRTSGKLGGFTLIELLIAFLIMGLLAAGMLPALASISRQSYHAEIVYGAPSVGQAALNYVDKEVTYNTLLNKTAPAWEVPAEGLTVFTSTVFEGPYKYAVSTAVSLVGIGNGALSTTSMVPGSGQTTPTTVPDPNSSTDPKLDTKYVLAWGTCSTLGVDNATDTWSVGNGYLEIKPGADRTVYFAIQISYEDIPTASNLIRVEVPVKSLHILGYDKQNDPEYSFVDVAYQPNVNSLPGQPTGTAIPASCSWQGRGKSDYSANDPLQQLLPSSSATIQVESGVGLTYYWPVDKPQWNPTSTTALYSFVPKSQLTDNKAAWNIVVTASFKATSDEKDRWVRIYVPTIAQTGTRTEYEPSTVTVTFDPYTITATWVAWESVDFMASTNAKVQLTIYTQNASGIVTSDKYSFSYVNTGSSAAMFSVPVRPLGLPKDILNMIFRVEPISPSSPAYVYDVRVNYWYR